MLCKEHFWLRPLGNVNLASHSADRWKLGNFNSLKTWSHFVLNL